MTLEDFLREVPKAASVKVVQLNYEQVAEEGDSLKVLGCYLIAVLVGVLVSGEHHFQPLTQ